LSQGEVDIHHTAVVGKEVALGVGVKVGPFAVISGPVILDDHVEVISHAYIAGKTFIGSHSSIYPFSSLGSRPQDLKYQGEDTELICGKHNVFREYCNVSIGTAHGGGKTCIGDNNLFMVNSHVAHDCLVGSKCVFANGVSLAGHIEVGDNVVLGGHSACHQFVKIGSYALLAGGSMVSQDVPPYVMVHGNHAKAIGINLIGLSRNGFGTSEIAQIKKIFRILYRSNYSFSHAKEVILETENSPIKTEFITFLDKVSRGINR
jgi:UDP-N-acetylglucosamine acyltransferase